MITGLQGFFLVNALITLFAAVKVVSSRKLVHAALWLVLALMGVAATFAMLGSRFFSVIQVFVYIGAIATLIIVAVMLTRNSMEDVGPQVNRGWWLPLVVVVLLFVGLVVVLSSWGDFGLSTRTVGAGGEDVMELGKALVDPNGFVLPFEIASALLLGAMVAAIYLATDRKESKR